MMLSVSSPLASVAEEPRSAGCERRCFREGALEQPCAPTARLSEALAEPAHVAPSGLELLLAHHFPCADAGHRLTARLGDSQALKEGDRLLPHLQDVPHPLIRSRALRIAAPSLRLHD